MYPSSHYAEDEHRYGKEQQTANLPPAFVRLGRLNRAVSSVGTHRHLLLFLVDQVVNP